MCTERLIDESPLPELSSLGKGCLQNSSEESHCFIYPKMANYFKIEKSLFHFLSPCKRNRRQARKGGYHRVLTR